MLLSDVLKGFNEKKKLNFKKFNPIIKGINFNSKEISKSFIFVAIKGVNQDGHKYIDDAIKKGAIFIIIENKSKVKDLKKKKLIFFLPITQNYFYQN